jgi:predicted Rossmann-fold nucleotide-binding protein
MQIVVDSMHERKVVMAERAAAFLGLPGGFGTFDEVIVNHARFLSPC